MDTGSRASSFGSSSRNRTTMRMAALSVVTRLVENQYSGKAARSTTEAAATPAP
ncbi:hypothetical protein D3C71_2051820 [compost metagenome]